MRFKVKSKILACILMFGMIFSVLVFPVNVFANQPYSSYWFPNTLLQWSPSADSDAKYNRSGIPLADRFVGEKVNSNASSDPQIMSLAIVNPHTSGTPSQGGDVFDVYAFGFWQYIDYLIAWAGSAGEGLIVPPSADIIDAGHKNGVPVLGTIFFPPTAYGGQFSWVQDFLQKNADGSFPVADKLIEVASYYGFDGWFINQETAGGNSTTAATMQNFMKYFQEHKPQGMNLVWYDAMTSSGSISWQNALTASNQMFFQDGTVKVSDEMFLNFNWTESGLTSSANRAINLGRSQYDLYAGIDVQANGYNTSVNWEGVFPSGSPARTSLGMYCPNWTFTSSSSVDEFYQKESRFWVGANGDPRNTQTSSNWKGIANYIIDKSPINDLPFITNFNTGNGNIFAVNGELLRNRPWNNRSLQDILPTWRWILDSSGTPLQPCFDWTTAYYGGSSLKVSGNLNSSNPTTIKLYKTNLNVSSNTELSITYKTSNSASNMKVGITFTDNPGQYTYLDVGSGTAQAWNTKTFQLGSYSGKTITAIALKFESSQTINNYSINIGQLAVKDSETLQTLPAVSNLSIEKTDFTQGAYADIRVKWDKLAQNVLQYEVYRVKPDETREFLGATPNNVYYVPPIQRISNETSTTLKVIAIDKYYNRGQEASISFNWSETPPVSVNIALNKTATANQYVSGETPSKAVDGSVTNNSKWCSNVSGDKWLKLDLGEIYEINRWVVKHAGAGGETSSWNTKNFKLQKSSDGTTWTDVDTVSDNTANITDRNVEKFNSQYIRLYITTPTQNTDNAARIYELELYSPDSSIPPDPVYPSISGNTSYEWIEGVNIGSLSNTSGSNNGYGDFTSISTNMAKETALNVSLTPGFQGRAYTEYWKIWIDLNRDGDFTDPGEELFSGNGTGTVTGTLTIPASASTGTTRMRVAMKYNSAPPSSGDIGYGEAEDYTVNIQ